MATPFEVIMQNTLKDDVEQLQKSGTLDLSENPAARDYLAGKMKIATGAEVVSFGPTRELSADEHAIYKLGAEIYARDAHCATCHQPDGKGVANIYPPLEKSNWLGDDNRLIKIALKGLWGPIEVNGQSFDPSKGVPPMTGFGPLLNDQELAAVLSYVRTSFGNRGRFITPQQVKAVRTETADRINFFDAQELLDAHPLEQTR
jgi:mono/diheme cytochrome c family protein